MKGFDENIFASTILVERSQTGWPIDRDASQEKHPTAKERGQRELTVTGLFAGIGGLEEGFRQAGYKSVMLCESDSLARGVLKKHFQDAELTCDVGTLKGLPPCDVLAAGFPCQDLSQVGRRRGITGPNSGLIGKVFELL